MDTTAATMHPAEEYLRNEQNHRSCMSGFTGSAGNCLSTEAGRTSSYYCERKTQAWLHFSDWSQHRKNLLSVTGKGRRKGYGQENDSQIQKLARLATHTNDWLRKIAASRP